MCIFIFVSTYHQSSMFELGATRRWKHNQRNHLNGLWTYFKSFYFILEQSQKENINLDYQYFLE
jgi:hypothetical protein